MSTTGCQNVAYPTREEWLQAATANLRETLFKQVQREVPPVRVSVGFPGGGSRKKRIGEHWKPIASSDNISQIFISPVLVTPKDVLGTLVHELIHAVYPDNKHGKDFKACSDAVGLVGKPTENVPGEALTERLNALAHGLGPYPHGQLNPKDGPKKQSTRLLKCQCPECGYTVRVTAKWLDEVGEPLCPCIPLETMIESDGEVRPFRMQAEQTGEGEPGEP